MNEKQIDRAIEGHKIDIKWLESQKVLLKSRKLWKCPGCNKRSPLGELKLGIEDYYVEPEGCSGGDYTTTADKPPYHIMCPKCKVTSRHWATGSKSWIKIHENLDGFKEIGHGSLVNEQGGTWHRLGDPPLQFKFNEPRRSYLDGCY